MAGMIIVPKKNAAAPAGISFVGGYSTVVGDLSAALSVSINGTLTGGSNSSPSAGDLVLACYAQAGSDDYDLSISGNTYGAFNELTELWANDIGDINACVSWAIMGSTVDTTLSGASSIYTTAQSHGMSVLVFRGVDSTTPIDTTIQTATGSNSIVADPPSITPVTSGAWVVAFGAGCQWGTGVITYSAADLSYFTTDAIDDTYGVTVGGGVKLEDWVSGAVNPNAFSASNTTTSCSWAAATVALRPA